MQLFVSLSHRLIADAVCSLFSSGQTNLRIIRGEIHQKTKAEINHLFRAVDRAAFILDTDSLRQLECKTDCSELLKTTILLTCPDELMLNGFSRRDVCALVSWDNSYISLQRALQAVQQNQSYTDPLLIGTIDEITRNGSTVLTNRQMQILRMVAAGDSSREIACKLRLSRRTVENHRARILERLSVSSAHEMIELAQQNNWI